MPPELLAVDVDPWDETPVTVPRGLLAVLLNAAGKADASDLLGKCPSDPCPICTALVEIHEAVYPIQGSATEPDIGGDVQPAKRQLVDDVVRDLVSRYPGTIQAVSLPTPDSALVRLHRGDSTWLVSVARMEVSDAT